ncbi:hypothetical protein DNTS_008659, partial [Danionella cerebrum]
SPPVIKKVMAGESSSIRRSLKSVFSRSEINLTRPENQNQARTTSFKLFKWKKKRSKEKEREEHNAERVESGAFAADSENPDGEEKSRPKTSLFGSVLRSKKGQRSFSESDLRKPKSFIASLSWKKKKNKKQDLLQDLKSYGESPEDEDHISEQDEIEVEKQVDFEPQPSCSFQDCMRDEALSKNEDSGFMPHDEERLSIPFIDSSVSDSDSYQTPPESPSPDPGERSSEEPAVDGKATKRSSEISSSFKENVSEFEPDIFYVKTTERSDSSGVCNSSLCINPSEVASQDDQYLIKSETSVDVTLDTDQLLKVPHQKDPQLPVSKLQFPVHHLPVHKENAMSSKSKSLLSSSAHQISSSIPDSPSLDPSITQTSGPLPKTSLNHLSALACSDNFKSSPANFGDESFRSNDTIPLDPCQSIPAVSSAFSTKDTLGCHADTKPSSSHSFSSEYIVNSETNHQLSHQAITTEPQQTNKYSSSTSSNTPNPAEPVLRNESDIYSSPSAESKTNTIIKSAKQVTFDLSALTIITPANSQGVPSDGRPYSEAETTKSNMNQENETLEPFSTLTSQASNLREHSLSMEFSRGKPQELLKTIQEHVQEASCSEGHLQVETEMSDQIKADQEKPVELKHGHFNVKESPQINTEPHKLELKMDQSSKEASVVECEGSEVLMAEAKEHILSVSQLKPAFPVHRQSISEEFTRTPPSSQVSLSNSSLETKCHLEISLHPSTFLQSGGGMTIIEEPCSEDHAVREEQAGADECGETGASFIQSQSPEESCERLTEETENNKTSSKQGEETGIKVKGGRDKVTPGVITQRTKVQKREEPDASLDPLPSESLTPGRRFIPSSTALSSVPEEASELGSDAEMASSTAVLNTKLSLPPIRGEKDDGVVVHKVSLVSLESPGNNQLNGVDQFQQSRASPELQRRWKNLHLLSEEPAHGLTERSDYTKSHYTSYHSSQSEEQTFYTAHVPLESENGAGRDGWELSERNREEFASPEASEREIRNTHAKLTPQLLILEEDDDRCSVFQATRVELVPSPTEAEPPALHPTSSFSEIDSLVDTLKSMERPLRQRVSRTPSNAPFSSLPPIEEDAPDSTVPPLTPVSPVTLHNGGSSSPLEINFSWSTPKEMRSPLMMMKEQQFGETPNRGLSLPTRASALNSIVMRRGSLNDAEDSFSKGLVNGAGSSRLENSFFFQGGENSSSRSMFRAASLPDIGSNPERMSSANKPPDALLGSRFERFSFLTSPSSSLSGLQETTRISMAPFLQNSSAETSGFVQKSLTEPYRTMPSDTQLKSPLSPVLQRSSSLDGGIYSSLDGGMFSGNFHQKPEVEQNLVLKYRAFPDAYVSLPLLVYLYSQLMQ